jgi:hypothetical protein
VSGRPKREKTVELTVESAETWENGGIGRNVALVGGQMAKREKRHEREKPLEREKPAERNGGIGRKRGKTVSAWPKRGKTVVAWPKWSKTVVARPKRGKTLAGRPKRGKTVAGRPKRRENGGTLTETGERDPAARFTALQWETAKRR